MGLRAISAPNRLTATEAAREIAAGDLSSEELVRAHLAHIASREPSLRAWSFLDPELAIMQAKARDASVPVGPLHGVPVAVKDVIDTCDMPTGMGSPIYDGYRPAADAACVAAMRAAGAVILGKTVTAEFAGVTPGPTANPHAQERTPGGSSSGSAAAVADYMVAIAFGTQTGGSIIRPAAFCGIIGFKPSYGIVSRTGLKFAAESFDTIGVMARDLDDIELCWRILGGRSADDVATATSPPRLALFRTHHWERAASESVAAIETTAAQLAGQGASVEELAVPGDFAELSEIRGAINNYERARALAWEWAHHRDQLSPRLAQIVADGWSRSYESYLKAVRGAERWRAWFAGVMLNFDAILTPSATGEAPVGLASTGDASFQEIWTLLHAPAITLPTCTGPSGLPVGIQIVGKRHEDAGLLRTARWVMRGDAR
jgi:amidase